MTSRLSSLLVRDGVVGVKRMEKAFQRQVLFGGGLDTILLEMTELNEQRLVQYLSLATGLPPATARELETLDPRARDRCPRSLAEKFGVVPLSFDGDALRVLTRDPVDLAALEDLANELGAPVQPFVSPEFRFELAFDRVFGRSSDERFARLAAASRLSAIPPVGRAPSVVVEAAGSSPAQAPSAEAIARAENGAAAAAGSASHVVAEDATSMTASAAVNGTGAGEVTSAAPAQSADTPAPVDAVDQARVGEVARAASIPDVAAAGDGRAGDGAAKDAGAVTVDTVGDLRSSADARAPSDAWPATGPAPSSSVAAASAGGAAASFDGAAAAMGGAAPSSSVAAAPSSVAAAPSSVAAAPSSVAAAPSSVAAAPSSVAAAPSSVAAASAGGVAASVAEAVAFAAEAAASAGGALASGGGMVAEVGAVALVEVTPEAVPQELLHSLPTMPVGRRTIEMTAESVRRRRQETDRMAAEAYRRHARSDTEPGTAPPDVGPPAEVVGAEVVIEYDSTDSGALEVTQRLVRPIVSDGSVVRAELERVDDSSPSVMLEPAAPSGPLVGGDSTGAVAPTLRRLAKFDPAPLGVSEARSLLAQADQRDRVFEVLLRAIRARTWYVSLLTVQGGAAIGRVALAGDEVDQTDITQVLIPLDTPSAFRQAVSSASPYIGPVTTGDDEVDGMIRRMGGVIPPSALLLPLVLKNRVVALVVGHRGGDMLRVTEVSELLPLAGSASDALGRIIRRGKVQSRQMAAVVPSTPEPIESGDPPSGPAARPAAASPEVEALMLAVEGGNDETPAGALKDALARAADVRLWLRDHFPGRLKVDRLQLGGRRLRPGQYGPLLDLVVRMGEAAAELVVEKLGDGRPTVRYYAALCALEMRLPSMRAPLVERLFDSDAGTREVALEALSLYPADQIDEGLAVVRRALRGDDNAAIENAAYALSALADVRAIPDLLDMLGRDGKAADVAARALLSLTKQDFGTNPRKWRQWWDKNQSRSRIEWLLEGLAHKDPQIRRSAVEDLRKTTGEYFGYHHDLPRREREQARQRWLDWWNQTGRPRHLG